MVPVLPLLGVNLAAADTSGASAVKGYLRIAADGASYAGGYNIASLTDTNTGDRTIVWDTDFSDTDYSIVTNSTENNQSNTRHFTFATGSVRAITSNLAETSNLDRATASIAIGAQ